MKTKLLNKSDIEAIILRLGIDQVLDKLVDSLEDNFTRLGSATPLIPARTGIQYQSPELGLIEWMPASVNEGTATLKLVAYHPTNPLKRRLPTVISSICVFDTDSGHLKGLLDGTFLTALRTGAMSAVATRHLASPSSRTLGIIGCGAQAVTQAHALSRHFDIDSILAYDVDPVALRTLAERISFTGIPVTCMSENDLSTLLQESDILCTCTSEDPGSGPLFPDFKNKPWLHINAVGSDFPSKIELPLDLLKRSYIVPDFLDQAMNEGECQQLPKEEIGLELRELLKQDASTPKSKTSQLTVFDSTGHAFADYVTGQFFLEQAQLLGLGTDVELECIPTDPKDPYSFLSGNARLAALPANYAKNIVQPTE